MDPTEREQLDHLREATRQHLARQHRIIQKTRQHLWTAQEQLAEMKRLFAELDRELERYRALWGARETPQ